MIFANCSRQTFTQTFELPMNGVIVTQANGVVTQLNTYTGVDPFLMNQVVVKHNVVEPFGRFVPCVLNEPA